MMGALGLGLRGDGGWSGAEHICIISEYDSVLMKSCLCSLSTVYKYG